MDNKVVLCKNQDGVFTLGRIIGPRSVKIDIIFKDEEKVWDFIDRLVIAVNELTVPVSENIVKEVLSIMEDSESRGDKDQH